MKTLVVDLEATCWDWDGDKKIPEGQQSEIIEIGLAMVETYPDGRSMVYRLSDNRLYIKPIASEVSQFCMDLTGITQRTLDERGVTLAEAIDLVASNKFDVWGSWGYYDLDMLTRDCQFKGVKKPWELRGNAHVNFKTMFTLLYGLKKAGVGKALERLQMKFHGDQHRGSDDAYNIARIVKVMLDTHKERAYALDNRGLPVVQ